MKEFLIISFITFTLAIGIIWGTAFLVGSSSNEELAIKNDTIAMQDTIAISPHDTAQIVKVGNDTLKVNNGTQPVTVIIEQPESKGMNWREMTTWCLGSANTLILIFLGYRKIKSRKNENN